MPTDARPGDETSPRPKPNPGHDVHFEIFVNSRKKTVRVAELSFEDILKLAFDPVPAGPTIAFTITYTRGRGEHGEGQLVAGETVKLQNGMNFNVSKCNRS